MKNYRVEIDDFGSIRWYKWGTNELHREDAPAVEDANGDKSWWINNELHREDGPAIEYSNGYKSWYLNGEPFCEQDWKRQIEKYNCKEENSCDGRIVEIEGKKYKLTEI